MEFRRIHLFGELLGLALKLYTDSSRGNDSHTFRPERMLDFEKLPPDAWKPFGIGVRSCIGRGFAEQEIVLNVALILQRFQVEMADPTYDLGKQDTEHGTLVLIIDQQSKVL